jgi:3-methyladenine DNA glycosylase AlkD
MVPAGNGGRSGIVDRGILAAGFPETVPLGEPEIPDTVKRRPLSRTGAGAVIAALRARANRRKAVFLQRFFKTGPGQYAAGDRFLGIVVPVQRSVAHRYTALALPEIRRLLHNPFHEVRLTALLIMVAQFERGGTALRERLFRTYLANTRHINNWDLVDLSAPRIVGAHIASRPRPLLQRLVRSPSLWERRIAVLATFHFLEQGRGGETVWVARQLLDDPHDLVHKAVGWMLRELGKRVDPLALRAFLDRHAHRMPRTMLRYAIEHLAPGVRARYLHQRVPRVPRRK